jgi:hypothetical protein
MDAFTKSLLHFLSFSFYITIIIIIILWRRILRPEGAVDWSYLDRGSLPTSPLPLVHRIKATYPLAANESSQYVTILRENPPVERPAAQNEQR